jgi:hypothetical protein
MRMIHEGTFELFSYWDRLRAGRSAPTRNEIEPGDIRKRLAGTFILEGKGAADASFRLAGTELCANHGRELKGTSFVDLWGIDDRSMMARILRMVFNQTRVVLAVYDGFNDRDRKAGFEMLLLPLSGTPGERRLLGSSFAVDRPYWLGSFPIVRCTLASVRVVDPDRDPVSLKNRPAIDLSQRHAASGMLNASARPASGYRRVGHLAVFDGGKPADR